MNADNSTDTESTSPPQAPDQRLVGGQSVAAPSLTPHKLSDSAPPFGGQGKGELWSLVARWERHAETHKIDAAKCVKEGRHEIAETCRRLSAVCANHARDLKKSLSEPRPQSEHRGDEPCAICDGTGVITATFGDKVRCGYCQGTGNRSERSVPPNVPAQATPHPTENDD